MGMESPIEREILTAEQVRVQLESADDEKLERIVSNTESTDELPTVGSLAVSMAERAEIAKEILAARGM
jgi:hypothetical protein